MPLISLNDLFKYGKAQLFPTNLVSPYRYVEHLIELSLKQKYGLQDVLEIGPGADPFLDYIPLQRFESVTILDYQPDFAQQLALRLSREHNTQVDALVCDIESDSIPLNESKKWDFVVANALLEHLRDDAGFASKVFEVLEPGGIFAGTTVLGPGMYNLWDHCVGHYRRYTADGLKNLFSGFAEVQLIQTSLLLELVRPWFFHRVEHLRDNSIAENNRHFNQEQAVFGSPPFAPVYRIAQKMFPLYLVFDWMLRDIQGGIGIVVARK